MIVLWVTSLFLHQGYMLVPVKTVQLGEPATLTCALPNEQRGTAKLFWYKQSVGDTLKTIVTLLKSAPPQYAPEFPTSRWEVSEDFRNLTILKTVEDDEGMYHCAVTGWLQTEWSATYLLIKGNTQRTSNYTVVQWPTASDPVRPGDSETLQCSVLSDSEDKTCPGDHSVFWFRAGSDESHPDIIYTDGNGPDKCEKRSDTQRSCVYHFSKTINSSDAGTYYCAVATCGEILFGKGSKLTAGRVSQLTALVIAIILVISVIINIVFICYRNPRAACKRANRIENASLQARQDDLSQPVHDSTEEDLNYAALHFSGGKATRGKMKREPTTEESVYSQVKCRM